LGVPDGYYTGDGVAQVWQYDGINFARISRVDHFGGGIQSLVTHSTGCTTFEDLYQTISDAEIDNEGIRNSLLSKEKNSQRQYDLGNLHASGNILCALLHEVDAQDGKHIDPHSAEEIRDCVRSLAEALGIPLPCLERIEDVAVSIGSSPNPFRSSTTIHYQIPPTPFIKGGKGDFVFSKGGAEGGGFTPSSSPPKLGGDIEGVQHVQLSIYDISGRLVKTLMDELQEPGVYQLQITKNQFPGSGIYFYRLNTSMGFTQTRKLILIR